MTRLKNTKCMLSCLCTDITLTPQTCETHSKLFQNTSVLPHFHSCKLSNLTAMNSRPVVHCSSRYKQRFLYRTGWGCGEEEEEEEGERLNFVPVPPLTPPFFVFFPLAPPACCWQLKGTACSEQQLLVTQVINKISLPTSFIIKQCNYESYWKIVLFSLNAL